MTDPILDRRALHRLTFAALGGLAAGAIIGCSNNTSTKAPEEKDKNKDKEANATPRLLQDPHVCRGINTCKGKGKTGTTNECAGEGHCATVKAHDCQGMNACKGQGGCGDNPGENECKGKGGCEVPLSTIAKKGTWAKARKRFEELMEKAGKTFGKAPAA